MNNRVCPQPIKWNELFNLLKNKQHKPSGGYEPGAPLILAAWYEAEPLFKMARFKEHIEWAANQGQLEQIEVFIKSLKEEDWFHLGE